MRLIEKPQVKSPPASCQNESVCTATATSVRSAATSPTTTVGAVPSGWSPTASGDSRTTQSTSGITSAKTASPKTPYVARRPTVRISHIATGTSRLIPAMEAPPRAESAVARRRVNQREITAEPATCPVAASPAAAPTP